MNSPLESQRKKLRHHLSEIKQQIQALESLPSPEARLLNYYYDQYRQTQFLLEKLEPHLDAPKRNNSEAG